MPLAIPTYSNDNKSVSSTITRRNSTNGSETASSFLNSEATAQDNSTNTSNVENQVKNNDTQAEPAIKLPTTAENGTLDSGSAKTSNEENGTNSGRRLLQDDVSKETNKGGKDQAATVENDEGLEAEADSSFDLFRDSDELADEYKYDYDD